MPSSEALALLARAPRVHLFALDSRQPLSAAICPLVEGCVLRFPWPWPSALEIAAPHRVVALASEHLTDLPAPDHGALGYEVRGEGMLVRSGDAAAVEMESIVGWAHLAQEWSPKSRSALLERIWQRGLPEDPRTVESIVQASPDTPTPRFLASPRGSRLVASLSAADAPEAIDLLLATWHVNIPKEDWAEAHRRSSAWVGARDSDGALIGSARAVSDWSRNAWVYDVMVAAAWRRKGLGKSLVRLLLEHPAVRKVSQVSLRAQEPAASLYARFGFVKSSARASDGTTEMRLVR